jgi:exopolyphosphatase/guanosine-5'-triphosphate,3'-diphosphate pyrophosphatase
MKLAAIDIGSNAARLLISEVIPTEKGTARLQKLNLIRVPLRLGFDVFDNNYISPEKETMLSHTMQAYRQLLEAYDIPLSHLKAAATSAMRDASNAKNILHKIKEDTGIEVEIISGDTEASIIYENHVAETLNNEKSYLYIDVGGGSTELSFFEEGKLKTKRSFNIGTIRLLKGQIDPVDWEILKDFIKKEIRPAKGQVLAIGSGGNINKLFSMSKRKEGKPLDLTMLKEYLKEMEELTIEQRMFRYNIKEDRADVIVPALQIYINVMRWADCEEIYVPKIGLADGLIQHLYEEMAGQAYAVK